MDVDPAITSMADPAIIAQEEKPAITEDVINSEDGILQN